MKFDLVLWANSGDQIQDRTLHRTKREMSSIVVGKPQSPNVSIVIVKSFSSNSPNSEKIAQVFLTV